MSFPLREVWSELLRSTSNNGAVLKELLENRPEIERATDLNFLFMNYISISYNVFSIKIEGGQIDPRVWLPSDHEFLEMLKLLVRYINDITTWIEDYDRTGEPWISIGEFYADSLLEVDAQCQRWWVLADMTIFNPATTPFKILPTMPLNEESVMEKFNPSTFNRFKRAPSVSPMEDSPMDVSTFEAPPSPALSLKQCQSPSSASPRYIYQPAMMSLEEGRIAAESAATLNDGADSSFAPQNSYGEIDQGFLYDGGVEPGELAVQQTTVLMPTTPRLEQNEFVQSHNPSPSFHPPLNKQGEFCQPMPPPAPKIAIPRLQNQGTFEPLFPPTQRSELRTCFPTPQTSTSGQIRKRGYTKVSPQALNGKPKKRRAVACEMPQHKLEYTGMQEFPPGSKLSHGSLMHGSPGRASGLSSRSYNTNYSASTVFGPVQRNAETLRNNLNTVPHKIAIGSQMDWNNTVSAAFDSEPDAANAGLGFLSPKISRNPPNLSGSPMMYTDMSVGYARPATSQQPMHFSSPTHSPPITGSDSRGASHESSRRLHHSAGKRDYVLGEDQSLENSQSNAFKPW